MSERDLRPPLPVLDHQERTLSFLRLPLAAQRRRARPIFSHLKRIGRLAVLLTIAGSFAGWLASSPVFALRTLSVEGVQRVPERWVEAEVEDRLGTNLLRLDLTALRATLERHQWVRSVRLHKRLPDRLVIYIREHQPVALLIATDRALFVDERGWVIAPVDADSPGLLRLRLDSEGLQLATSFTADDQPTDGVSPLGDQLGDQLADALADALGVARLVSTSALAWAGPVDEVELLGPHDFRVHLSQLEFPLLVRADTPVERLTSFDRLLRPLTARLGEIGFVDLRFARRIVVRPSTSQTPPLHPENTSRERGLGHGQA